MRVALVPAFAAFAAAACLGACVGSMPSGGSGGNGGGGGPTQDTTADAGVGGGPDLATPADLMPQPLSADLGSTDLAGFVNCFGAAVCDPASSFCIRFSSGSAATPGTTQTPACYAPVDCMGANMNCDC
ncbi:MAG TPA: hypothetical protein VF945_02510, partial [Polyangia bacterium]